MVLFKVTRVESAPIEGQKPGTSGLKKKSGCCKPSDSCNFTYVSSAYWNKMTETLPNTDCALWDNDPNVLCFDCESCKAGFLDSSKSMWKRVAVGNVVYLVCLIIVYSIGCCALRNNKHDNSWRPRCF